MGRIVEEMLNNREKLNTSNAYVVSNGDYKVLMVQTTPEEEAERLLKERILSENVNGLTKKFEKIEKKSKKRKK